MTMATEMDYRTLILRDSDRQLLIAALDYCHQANITDGTVDSRQDKQIVMLIDALSIAMRVTLER